MKKILALLLSFLLVFVFVGCSDNGTDELTRQINITWQADNDIQPENKYFSNTPTPIISSGVFVKAELLENGEPAEEAKFDFVEEKGSPKFNMTEKKRQIIYSMV